MKNKIIQGLVNFFKDFSKINIEALKTYREQKNLASGDKSISNARLALVLVILANCMLRLVLPLALVILMIIGLFKILFSLLVIGWLIYLLLSHLADKKINRQNINQQDLMALYQEVSQLIFSPLRELDTWLNVKQPQGLTDISIHPYCGRQNEVDKLFFKLLKKFPEPIEDDKIAFSVKMLQSLITSKLHEKQMLENRTLFYNDIPCIVVDHITDFGDYIQIQIAHVNNESNFNYVKQKTFVRQPTQTKTQLFDEDF